MDGFEKIELDSKEKTTTVADVLSRKSSKGHMKRNVLLGIGAFLILLIVFVIVGIILPAIPLMAQARSLSAEIKTISVDAKMQNIEAVSNDLTKLQTELVSMQGSLQRMGYVKFFPIASMYYNDAVHMVQAGLYGLDGGEIAVNAIKPYADVLGLKGEKSFTGGSAEQRIQTAVSTLGKVTPQIDNIAVKLDLMKKEIDQVDPNHYPSVFGGDKVKTSIAQAKTVVDDAVTFINEARPLVKVIPTLLGEPTETKYLILFQNDKELRPTGGFITAYAIMRLDHGVPRPDASDDIYSLDATVPNKPKAPQILLDYLPEVPLLNLRDTNLSPDFVDSMNTFNKMYQTAGGYKKVNGIIAIDTYPLVAALDILGGSITVDGTTFTTKNDPRCNCPNVIYQLEAAADQPVEYIRTQRKGIIGDLMLAIMQKALASSPKQYWGPLLQAMITDMQQKHILFDLSNPDAQAGLEALNVAGRILPFDGDYLHINEANFGGAKSNTFVTENVTQDYTINSDGTIVKTVTINYKNPFPPSDCNLEHGQLCLNAILRDFVRVYVPKGSNLISSKGSEVKVTTADDLGKTVFEGFLTVRPQGSATYTLQYELPFKLANNSPLPAMYQKQPGTNANVYTVNVNGKQVEQFPLDTDKIIKINK